MTGHPERASGAPIEIGVLVAAPAARVWEELSQIEHHAEWMADAVAIRFTGAQRRGVGTRFLCDTQVGPFRLTDEMEVTAWDDGRRIGVVHRGVVTGEGRFLLEPLGPDATRVTWHERLTFPWWMGARPGAWAARPVLRFIWVRNLGALKRRIETPGRTVTVLEARHPGS